MSTTNGITLYNGLVVKSLECTLSGHSGIPSYYVTVLTGKPDYSAEFESDESIRYEIDAETFKTIKRIMESNK